MRQILDEMPDGNGSKWDALRELILESTEIDAIHARYPRSKRNEIEQRWSFSEMIKVLRLGDPERGQPYINLLHPYGMSSHLAHADWTGANFVWERAQLDPERQFWIGLAQSGRVIGDVISTCTLRVSAAREYKSLSLNPVAEVFERTSGLHTEFANAYARWRTIAYGHPME